MYGKLNENLISIPHISVEQNVIQLHRYFLDSKGDIRMAPEDNQQTQQYAIPSLPGVDQWPIQKTLILTGKLHNGITLEHFILNQVAL